MARTLNRLRICVEGFGAVIFVMKVSHSSNTQASQASPCKARRALKESFHTNPSSSDPGQVRITKLWSVNCSSKQHAAHRLQNPLERIAKLCHS